TMRFKPLAILPNGRISFDGVEYDVADPKARGTLRDLVHAQQRSAIPRADAVEEGAVQALLDEMAGFIAGMTDALMRGGELLSGAMAPPETPEEAMDLIPAP